MNKNKVVLCDGMEISYSTLKGNFKDDTQCILYNGIPQIGGTVVTNALKKPTFSVPSGDVTSGTKVKITSSDNGTIFYTTDGSNPTFNSEVYSSEITISNDTTIKAIVYKKDCLNSQIETVNYYIKD